MAGARGPQLLSLDDFRDTFLLDPLMSVFASTFAPEQANKAGHKPSSSNIPTNTSERLQACRLCLVQAPGGRRQSTRRFAPDPRRNPSNQGHPRPGSNIQHVVLPLPTTNRQLARPSG